MKNHTCYFTILSMYAFLFPLYDVIIVYAFVFVLFFSVLFYSLSCFHVLLIYCMFVLLNVDPRESSCCQVQWLMGILIN